MEEATALWVVGKSQPRQCDPVFKVWVAKGGMTRERVWERIELAMKSRRLSLTTFLEKQLSKKDRRWVRRWRDMHRKPAESLHLDVYHRDLPIARKIVRHGIKRLVRRDTEAAVSVWKRVRATHLKHDPQETLALDESVALRAAASDHPQALALLGALEDPSENIKEWRVRLALKQQQWKSALMWIETLPVEERNSERWQYWRARILQSQSVPVLGNAAQRIFSGLATERSYHGFLAADRLGVPYSFEDDALQFSEADLQALEDVPPITRARELFKLKRLVDARREWFYAIGDFAEPDLRKAAVLASRWGWHDRAIATVAKGDHFDDIQLRFPMAYKDLVLSSAGEQAVDPAWVYGVLRQESGFMSDARSSAGALGLMQLMPQTGRMTARKLKTRVRSNYEILDVNKNIRLGAAYLQNMLKKKNGHSAMATAAYNAGPNRVSAWLPQSPMAADVWIESIPYNETRKYVKRVMSYTVIYDYLLDGETGQMSQRMPVVQPLVKKDS
jgi:soluble lytic murein transglycosylase